MSRYSEPDGPSPEQEAAMDYDNLRDYCHSLEALIRSMVEAKDPLMDVADAVSFYDAWCKEAIELLPKPRDPNYKPYVPAPYLPRDDGEPF